MALRNIHATAVVVDFCGLLILGDSGSGKSLLARELIADMGRRGRYAALVSDDRVWLSAAHGRLIAEAPTEIAGLLELRGYGPANQRHEPRSVIDRLVRLVDAADAPRLRDTVWDEIAGVPLPCLRLSARNTLASVAAIGAWLQTAVSPQA